MKSARHRPTAERLRTPLRFAVALRFPTDARQARKGGGPIGFVPFEKIMTSIHEIWSKKNGNATIRALNLESLSKDARSQFVIEPFVAPSAQNPTVLTMG
jgi:hypothetical protein